MPRIADPVIVSLGDLEAGTVSIETVHKAFGPDSLGILLVDEVPAEFFRLRAEALSYGSYIGSLPEEQLEQLAIPAAKYVIGWSRGKERLRNGQPDMHKGSFYASCAFPAEPGLTCARPPTGISPAAFPEYLLPNVWPAPDVLPGMQRAMEALCRMVLEVAALVARACDLYAAAEMADYSAGYLERVVRTSTTTKARLLHYFPVGDGGRPPSPQSLAAGGEVDCDDWCAVHLDHGCLTGLTSAMYVDEAVTSPAVPAAAARDKQSPDGILPTLAELDGSPDPAAGLYIRSRTGETLQVQIPRHCIAFQTGQTLERITRGRLQAVPHFVRGIRPGGAAATGPGSVARNTLAIFTQPNLDEVVDVDAGLTFGQFAQEVLVQNMVRD